MNYLVDANVLCEPTKPKPMPQVIDWLRRHEREISIDAIIIGEIRFGILLLPSGYRRRRLEAWFMETVKHVHCLSWDTPSGLRWAVLCADLRSSGQAMPIKDSLIAATALVHGLTVVTRNTNDFAKAKVKIVNPFV